jgi:hypothetical protein
MLEQKLRIFDKTNSAMLRYVGVDFVKILCKFLKT